jgi:hypothetical protein
MSWAKFNVRVRACFVRFASCVKRRNVQEAFVGEPTGDPHQSLDNYAEGDEAVDIAVRGGKVQLLVPAGTPDGDVFERQTFLGGELELEDGRVLSFQIQASAVGAQASVLRADEHDRGVGLSSIPDVPGGV